MTEKTIEKQKLLTWLSSAPSELSAKELLQWIENQTQNEK